MALLPSGCCGLPGLPAVDDPFDFGRVAAANSISDVYAMGGRPILALSVLGMPVDKLPSSAISDIVRGGVAVCRDAGIPLAGACRAVQACVPRR